VIKDTLDDVQGEVIPAMIAAFKLANKDIVDKKSQDRDLESMACVATMALVDITNNQFYYAHVGDTRLYLLRDGSLIKISKDHSFVGFLEDSGRITETAAMNHPKRNEINKALGFTTQIDTDEAFIETGQSPFLPGDMLLLCSDGLTDLVDKAQITTIVNGTGSLDEKAGALINAANTNGGKDNVTVVLVKNDKAPVAPTLAVPATPLKKKIEPDAVIDTNRLANQTQTDENHKVMPSNRSNGLTILLGVLCLVFLASSIWLYMQGHKGQASATAVDTATTAKKMRNTEEIKLQDAIDVAKGDTLYLSDSTFKQPVLLTDTLHIDQDSLYIKVKGNLVIKRDTSYNGPALAISSGSKAISLENLQFDDFGVAVHLKNTALGLKNVKFNNCKIPVQKDVMFNPGKPVTTYLQRTNIYTDTIAKTSKKPNGTR